MDKLEQLNIVRERMGQAPLTELPPSEPPQSPESAAETEKVEQANDKPSEEVKVVAAELNDDAVLEYLKGKGIPVSSLTDLNKPLTEADIQVQKEKRENDKLSYGLNKGLFNRSAYENYISDSKDKQNLVFAHYYDEAKKEDGDLSDEDIQAEFAAKYGLDAEPGTRKHKRGQQEISVIASELLRAKYPKIVSLDAEYDQYESAQLATQSAQRQIAQSTPAYQKDLKDVFAELNKIPAQFSDGSVYQVEILDASIEDIKSHLSSPEFMAQQIQNGWTKESLRKIAYSAMITKNFPIIAEEIAKQAVLNHQKGIRGIPTTTGRAKEEATTSKVSDRQQQALDRVFPGLQTTAAN